MPRWLVLLISVFSLGIGVGIVIGSFHSSRAVDPYEDEWTKLVEYAARDRARREWYQLGHQLPPQALAEMTASNQAVQAPRAAQEKAAADQDSASHD